MNLLRPQRYLLELRLARSQSGSRVLGMLEVAMVSDDRSAKRPFQLRHFYKRDRTTRIACDRVKVMVRYNQRSTYQVTAAVENKRSTNGDHNG